MPLCPQETYMEKEEKLGRILSCWAWELETPLWLDTVPLPSIQGLPSPPLWQVPSHPSSLGQTAGCPPHKSSSTLYTILEALPGHRVSQLSVSASCVAGLGDVTSFWPTGVNGGEIPPFCGSSSRARSMHGPLCSSLLLPARPVTGWWGPEQRLWTMRWEMAEQLSLDVSGSRR